MLIEALPVFVRVVEEKSFTAAAARLGMPKSTVSKRVAELEESLGVQLLVRSTRSLRLTDAGQRYYERVRIGMATLQDAERDVHDLDNRAQGVLRVASPVLFGQVFLGPALEDYLRAHPSMRLDVTLTDRRVDLVDEGYDVVIRAGVIEESSLHFRRLGATSRVLCASREYVRRRGMPASPADLRDHDCVVFKADEGEAVWQLDSGRNVVNLNMAGKLAINSMLVVREAILMGLGIGMLPAVFVNQLVEQGDVVRVLPEWANARGELHVLYPSGKFVPLRIRHFVDLIVERFNQTSRDQGAEKRIEMVAPAPTSRRKREVATKKKPKAGATRR